MPEPSSYNPMGRFSGLADLYAKYRPSYPAEALDFIQTRCGLAGGALLVDVGCGTGISSRLWAARGVQVIGVEPNADMRGQAETEAVPLDVQRPEYRAGRAEATGLPEAYADAVLAAQAFHWFEPEAALREFHRILKPGGWAVLLWNLRDETDPFTAAYGEVIRTLPEVAAVEGSHAQSGVALLICPLFQHRECLRFPHAQPLSEEGVLGRAFSASYAPRQEPEAGQFAAALRAVFGQFQREGKVALRYETVVYIGQRSSEVAGERE
jgi:SAM-dependent methyltransferase